MGVLGHARTCVCRSEQVCEGVHGHARVCAGVHGCVFLC